MSVPNKLQKDRNQKIILELAALPGNNICADCKARNPRWASHSLGIFICMNCASIHRKIGTHITKVKSLTMDVWSNEQLETMKLTGNIKSNAIYNPNEWRHPPPPNLEDTERDSEIEQYVRAKYETRKFMDKSALVASRLGPSRSASSATPRSATAPTVSASSSRAPAPATTSSSKNLIPPSSTQPPQRSNPLQPQNPPRSASQPTPSAQTNTPTTGLGGVWDDINSLASAPSQNSSLPLQYQTTSSFANAHATQQPYVHGAMGSSGYPVGLTTFGTGINPYQPPRTGMNPFAPSATVTGSPFVPQSPMPPQFQQPPTQYLASPMAQSTTPIMNRQPSGSFFQPQPQGFIQAPSSQNFLAPSPSQSINTSPSGQPQFLTPSPSQQFPSHSPQLMEMQPPQSVALFPNPTAAQTPMQFGSSSGQSPFLGTTTMQMQQQLQQQQQQLQQLQQQQQLQLQQSQQQQQQQLQQQLHQQQQQQQQRLAQSVFNQGHPQMYGQAFPQGGYSTQGPQWGSM